VQDSRLVFKSSEDWATMAATIAHMTPEQRAAWQKSFPGFAPLSPAAAAAALKDMPDGEHPVDAFFLAMLNKDGMYQIGKDVFFFAKNVLYTVAESDKALLEQVRQELATGTVKPAPGLKINVFRDHPPVSLLPAAKTGSVGITDDHVQYQWYQGNNIYFKYRTRLAINSSYYYFGQPTAEVYLVNVLEYSKSNVSWWANAGENANKAFSSITIQWSGIGQMPVPYANGYYAQTGGTYTLPDVSRSDNQNLELSRIILASHIDAITVSGAVSNSVNWNTWQSNTQNLNYTYYNLNP
jgi:hypothetical protein